MFQSLKQDFSASTAEQSGSPTDNLTHDSSDSDVFHEPIQQDSFATPSLGPKAVSTPCDSVLPESDHIDINLYNAVPSPHSTEFTTTISQNVSQNLPSKEKEVSSDSSIPTIHDNTTTQKSATVRKSG